MISSLIKQIENDSRCEVYKSQGVPSPIEGVEIPEDLKEFYSLCGGLVLFEGSKYQWNILSVEEIKNAQDVIREGEPEIKELKSFVTIAEDGNGDFLAISISGSNVGQVVDAFHETFGDIGDTTVIALSFTEFLTKLYRNGGNYPYWLEDHENVYRDWFEVSS